MPRAPTGPPPPPPPLFLLLMAALASNALRHRPAAGGEPWERDAAAPPPLELVNPWLSACDLQPASAADLQGACTTVLPSAVESASAGGCPAPCPALNSTTTQCLHYLDEAAGARVCAAAMSPRRRRRELQGLRLRHCCEHAADAALADAAALDGGARGCLDRVRALLDVDALAARVSCEHAEILARYDCAQTYSIKYRCDDCKEAYRRWVCSSLVPHFSSPGHRVRPCVSVCQSVEKRCPYMLPGDRAPAHPTQYAGEPTFLCLDPNIPESGSQRDRSSHGDEDCCYTHCGAPGRGLCARCANSSATATTARPRADGGDAFAPPTAVQCAAASAPRAPACRAVAAVASASASSSSSRSTSARTRSSPSSRALAAAAAAAAAAWWWTWWTALARTTSPAR